MTTTGRTTLAVAALALGACAPLLDFEALTAGEGADASVQDAPDDRTAREAGSDGEARDVAAEAVADAPAADPCALVTPTQNGYYCGRSMQNGFAGGDPDTLYLCVDAATAGTQTCATGCVISVSGWPDCCDHCTGLGDGTYCGSALGYTGGYASLFDRLRNVVFVCEGGVYGGRETPCGSGKVCVQDGSVATCN
jgi:hypothetical protein